MASVIQCHSHDEPCILYILIFVLLKYGRRVKTVDGKGNTKSLKWITSKVEDLADANGYIEADKLKEWMRSRQVYI